MTEVYVAGVGMTAFKKHADRTLDDLGREALELALKDAGAERSDLETAYYSGATNGFLQDQHLIPGQVVLSKIGVESIPVLNVEAACASGAAAFHLAAQAIQSGSADIALALGIEKMNIPDKARMFAVFDSGWDVEDPDENLKILLEPSKDFPVPEGHESPKPYSVFMAVYAALCRQHMHAFGTTQRQIAAVCAKNHQHSVHNPLAQFQAPYTIDEVLAAAPITYPLTLPMCAPISDGAAAAILCSARGLERLGGRKSRAVRVMASMAGSSVKRPADRPDLNSVHRTANRAYEKAGVGPDDMHVAEVHDATAMGEILHAENLSLVPFGEGGPAAERGEFTIGGRVPINPSGGLESKGHPIGATGLGQVHELVTQLRHEAGPRQVEGARRAVQENSGGLIDLGEAAVVINILERSAA
ncbi:MAG: thiolase family protein [Pseudomonadota bacterium]